MNRRERLAHLLANGLGVIQTCMADQGIIHVPFAPSPRRRRNCRHERLDLALVVFPRAILLRPGGRGKKNVGDLRQRVGQNVLDDAIAGLEKLRHVQRDPVGQISAHDPAALELLDLGLAPGGRIVKRGSWPAEFFHYSADARRVGDFFGFDDKRLLAIGGILEDLVLPCRRHRAQDQHCLRIDLADCPPEQPGLFIGHHRRKHRIQTAGAVRGNNFPQLLDAGVQGRLECRIDLRSMLGLAGDGQPLFHHVRASCAVARIIADPPDVHFGL